MTRLPAGIPARLIVTDLLGATTTWLQKSLLAATFTPSLNQPSQITADLRSADIAVNTIFAADGDPLVAQSNRLVHVLLEETPGTFTCRGAGIIMSPQDQGDADTSTTHLTAYDGWQWLMGVPVFADDVGTPISSGFPRLFTGPGNQIVYEAIQSSLASLLALGLFGPAPGQWPIDIPPAYGGTAFWSGTDETTPTINVYAQQGTTLGEFLATLASFGADTSGTAQCIDIWFEPIYDPRNRPGYINQVSVFNLMGSEQPAAPMGWGRLNRAATTATRQHDGTPGSFVNVANFIDAGGWPVLPVPVDAPSVAKYYAYYSQQTFPSQYIADSVLFLANQALTLYKQGKRTFLMDLDPLRAALPFRDYNIGDRVPVYSERAQRVAAQGYQRVQAIPVLINSDGVTEVRQLLTSPDWPGDNVA